MTHFTLSLGGDLVSSKNLRKLAEENPKAKGILLYKAEIQDRKHEILTNEEEYLKVLNIVDAVLTQVEDQLKEQSEGICYSVFFYNPIQNCTVYFFS